MPIPDAVAGPDTKPASGSEGTISARAVEVFEACNFVIAAQLSKDPALIEMADEQWEACAKKGDKS